MGLSWVDRLLSGNGWQRKAELDHTVIGVGTAVSEVDTVETVGLVVEVGTVGQVVGTDTAGQLVVG
jgi:hypothetical protein